MTKPRNVRVRRIYEDPEPADGRRILVDMSEATVLADILGGKQTP